MNNLLNLVGLATGLALYAMLLVMVIMGRRAAPGPARAPVVHIPIDPLPLSTAILGVLWNVCALSIYTLPRVGLEAAVEPASAMGFIALGFLPAVVVHSVVRGEPGQPKRMLRHALLLLAYSASGVAAVLQIVELAAARPVPAPAAMQLLTWSFIGLVLPLVFTTRRQPGARRALWAASLAAFAVSAFHLSGLHEAGNPWPIELAGHHASIPLAVAILYQDFPFALADIFLKRALLLIGLIGAAFAGLSLAGVTADTPPARLGFIAACSVVTALAYPWIRRGSSWFVDRIVLARPDYRLLEATIARRFQSEDGIEAVLDEMRQHLTPALGAASCECVPRTAERSDPLDPPVHARGSVVQVSVPTTEPPFYALRFHLPLGRRILSDDTAALSAIAVAAARRIDAIRLTQERYDSALRQQEVAALATEAELRALRAQLNPHFLFNALTTIGHLIQTAPDRALGTLMRLTSLLRAVLRSEGQYTTLGRELDLVETYLEIERARFEDRLRVHVEIDAGLRELQVPSLVLQPIVENAVKHGIAPRRTGGDLIIGACAETRHDGTVALCLRVTDTGEGCHAETLARGRVAGVGLNNVERRLSCCYGEAGSMTVTSAPGRGMVVEVRMPLERPDRVTVQRAG